MIAVEQGHEEVVRVILQQSKSDVHQAANDGTTTALSLARKLTDDQKVSKLLHQVTSRPRPLATPSTSDATTAHFYVPPTLPTAHRPPPTAHRRRPSSVTCLPTTAGAHRPLPMSPADGTRV